MGSEPVNWAYWRQVKGLTAEEFSLLRHGCDPGGSSAADPALKRAVAADVRLASKGPVRGGREGVLTHPLKRWIAWARKHDLKCPEHLVKSVRSAGRPSLQRKPVKPGLPGR